MNSRGLRALFTLFLVGTFVGIGKGLTLSEAVLLALANHPDIKRAQFQVSLAELELSSAQVKNLLPTLSLSVLPGAGTIPQANLLATLSFPLGTSNKFTGRFSLQPGPSWEFSWGVDFSLGFDLANPMAAGGSLANLSQALEDARASLEKTKATVIVNVVKGYFDFAFAQGQSRASRGN